MLKHSVLKFIANIIKTVSHREEPKSGRYHKLRQDSFETIAFANSPVDFLGSLESLSRDRSCDNHLQADLSEFPAEGAAATTNDSDHDDHAAEDIDDGSSEPNLPNHVLEELDKISKTETKQLQDLRAVVQEYVESMENGLQDHRAVVKEKVESMKNNLGTLASKIQIFEWFTQKSDEEEVRLINRARGNLLKEITGRYLQPDVDHITPIPQEVSPLQPDSQSGQSTLLSTESFGPFVIWQPSPRKAVNLVNRTR